MDCRRKVGLSMLEGGLQGPAMPGELHHLWGRYLTGYMGQDVESRSAMAGRMIPCEPHTPQDVLGAVFIHHTHAWLGHVPCRGPLIRLQRTENLKGQPLGLAKHEETAAGVHFTPKRAGTKMAIGDPEILGRARREPRSEQRALLCMPIFTRKDIGDQAGSGLLNDKRLPGQGPPGGLSQDLEPMLAGCQTVAVDNFDPVAVEPRGTRPVHLGNQGGKLAGTIAHQFCGGVGL